jgi:glutamate-1-semialdehyde 2,1-aminomutase
VHADLVTYGKIIGGGFPVGAVAGPTVLMNLLAPAGPVYQAGTLSGNPVATTAGITVLQELKEHPDVYKTLDTKGEKLQSGIAEIFNNCEIPAQINRVGSMISVFFSKEKIKTFNDIKNADMELFSAFFHQMLENGIHLPPSGYESWFLATSLTDELIEKTIEATEKSVQQIKIEIT